MYGERGTVRQLTCTLRTEEGEKEGYACFLLALHYVCTGTIPVQDVPRRKRRRISVAQDGNGGGQ